MRSTCRGLCLLGIAIISASCTTTRDVAEPNTTASPSLTPTERHRLDKKPNVPTRADVPAEYVDSAYAAELWEPAVRSDCARRLGTPPRAHRGRDGYFIYFSCHRKKGPSLPAAAAREAGVDERSARTALRALLRGPTREELDAGFASNFGPQTADLPFTLRWKKRGRVAVVDLDEAILDVEFVFVSVQDVAQITSTVGQFPMVQWVVILIEGQPLCRALREC